MSEMSPAASPPSPATPPRRSRAPLIVVVLLLLGGVGVLWWLRHTASPEYKARQRLAEAQRRASLGDLVEAAKIYRELAEGTTEQAKPASDAFRLLLERLDTAPLATALDLSRLALDWPHRPDMSDGVAERVQGLLREKADTDPTSAMALSQLLMELTPDPEERLRVENELGAHMKRWHEKDPNDLQMAISYAQYLGRPGRFDANGVIRVLEPHRRQFGADNGARLLGQAYSQQGKLGPALALLEPYCRLHLPKLLETEAQLRKTFAGTEPGGEARRRLLQDPEVRELVMGRMQHAWAAPATQDLARLYLARARTRPDLAARQADLKDAEELLRQLRQTRAAQTNTQLDTDIRFQLAAVAFLLGKQELGRERLQEVLDGYRRDPSARLEGPLLRGATVLEAVGDLAGVRRLVEEAYQACERRKDERGQKEIALRRYQLAGDADDRVQWLDRCDTARPEIQAALALAQGDRSRQKGRTQDAVAQFRRVTDLFAAMPRRPDTLREGGLAWLSLFQVTGEKAALEKGTALIEHAIASQPAGAGVPPGVLDALREAACRDLVLDGIDLVALRRPADLDYLAFLYADRAGRDAQFARLRQHPVMQLLRTHLVKLLDVVPAQPAVYQFLLTLALFDRDDKLVQDMEARLRNADIDFNLLILHLSNQYAGKVDERQMKDRQAALQTWEERVKELRKKGADRTLAVALTGLGFALQRGEMLGEEPDADRLVKVAEEARAACQCRGTTQQLADALLYRAHRQLNERDGEYRRTATKLRRVLNSSYLVALALTGEGQTAKDAAGHPDVVRACKLLQEMAEAYVDEPQAWVWAMLSRTHPETAAKVAEGLKRDEMRRLARAITLRLNPLGLMPALDEYWVARLEGKEKEGKEPLRRLAECGVPLPFALD